MCEETLRSLTSGLNCKEYTQKILRKPPQYNPSNQNEDVDVGLLTSRYFHSVVLKRIMKFEMTRIFLAKQQVAKLVELALAYRINSF